MEVNCATMMVIDLFPPFHFVSERGPSGKMLRSMGVPWACSCHGHQTCVALGLPVRPLRTASSWVPACHWGPFSRRLLLDSGCS